MDFELDDQAVDRTSPDLLDGWYRHDEEGMHMTYLRRLFVFEETSRPVNTQQ